MATLLKLGSLLLDGTCTKPGAWYREDTPISSGPAEGLREISFGSGKDLVWVVVNGLLIADRTLLVNISWNDIDERNLVFGKEISIDGYRFWCRLLKLGEYQDEPNEWDAALDATQENNGLWHWRSIFFWGQEQRPAGRVMCGYYLPRNITEDGRSPSTRCTDCGYRPVLELLPSDHLVAGSKVSAAGRQTFLTGTLLDVTEHDAIIKPARGAKLAELDTGTLYAKLPDGTVAVDRSQMVVQMKEA